MKIFLIGFMGVGKTTIGKKLATQTEYGFIDSDKYIVKTPIKVTIESQ